MTEPINILLVVTEAGRDSCKLPFITTKEDKAEMQEETVSLADANEISMTVAVAAIFKKWMAFSHSKKSRAAAYWLDWQ